MNDAIKDMADSLLGFGVERHSPNNTVGYQTVDHVLIGGNDGGELRPEYPSALQMKELLDIMLQLGTGEKHLGRQQRQSALRRLLTAEAGTICCPSGMLRADWRIRRRARVVATAWQLSSGWLTQVALSSGETVLGLP